MMLNRCGTRKRECGVVLGVVLVLLAAGSVLSALSMRGSIVDEMIVRNYATKEATFRAAELAARSAGDDASLASALAAGAGESVSTTLDWRDDRLQTSATLTAEGSGLAQGYSIGQGGFVMYRFRARGESLIPGAAATSVVEQGVERLSPAP